MSNLTSPAGTVAMLLFGLFCLTAAIGCIVARIDKRVPAAKLPPVSFIVLLAVLCVGNFAFAAHNLGFGLWRQETTHFWFFLAWLSGVVASGFYARHWQRRSWMYREYIGSRLAVAIICVFLSWSALFVIWFELRLEKELLFDA